MDIKSVKKAVWATAYSQFRKEKAGLLDFGSREVSQLSKALYACGSATYLQVQELCRHAYDATHNDLLDTPPSDLLALRLHIYKVDKILAEMYGNQEPIDLDNISFEQVVTPSVEEDTIEIPKMPMHLRQIDDAIYSRERYTTASTLAQIEYMQARY